MDSQIRPVYMPKTGSTAAAHHTGHLHQHRPATELRESYPSAYLVGFYRGPAVYYASWYTHSAKWGETNARARAVLRVWGRGSSKWLDVLRGLTHPEAVDLEAIRDLIDHHTDPLYRVGPGPGGMYARALRLWFGDGSGGWAVDELVPTSRFDALGVKRRNTGPGWTSSLAAQALRSEEARGWLEGDSAAAMRAFLDLVKGPAGRGETWLREAANRRVL